MLKPPVPPGGLNLGEACSPTGRKKDLKKYGHTTHQTAFSIGYWHRVDSPFTVPPGYAGDPGSDRGPAKALGLTMPAPSAPWQSARRGSSLAPAAQATHQATPRGARRAPGGRGRDPTGTACDGPMIAGALL